MKNDLEIRDLDTAIQKINETIKTKPKLSSKLLELRKKLESMKVALLELHNLRDDFERGNITNESYRIQSKRLRTDLERSRNEANLLDIINTIEEKEKRSMLIRLKDKIISNKDFILLVLEVIKILTKSSERIER